MPPAARYMYPGCLTVLSEQLVLAGDEILSA